MTKKTRMASSSPGDNEKKGGIKRVIRIAALVLILLLIPLGLYQCGILGNRREDNSDVIIGAGVKQGEMDNGGETDKREADSNGKSEMTVRMNGYPVFADGQSEGNLNIVNPAVNELYMNVEISLKNSGEVIYDSGAIPPKHYVDTDKLDIVLEKGIYEATAHVTLYDPEYPDTNYNSANFTLLITIES